ncbi:MAG: Mov34/MPN/PAD-1 family protein [Candidatus Hodarchaeales archaeon]|jgi:proteasome lid subunit RPN8/RPN11
MKKYPFSAVKVVNEIPGLLGKMIRNIQRTGSRMEACALIFGFKEPGMFRLTDYQEVDNTLESSTSFLVDPEKLVNMLVRFEDEWGKELVSIIHSHPGHSNTPSIKDLKYMNYWRIPWFISRANPLGSDDIRVFIHEDDEIKEIMIDDILNMTT